MSCGVGRRCGSDLALFLWLWYRLVATAPIGPLAWKPLHVIGAALKRQKKKKKNIKQKVARSIGKRPAYCFASQSLLSNIC